MKVMLLKGCSKHKQDHCFLSSCMCACAHARQLFSRGARVGKKKGKKENQKLKRHVKHACFVEYGRTEPLVWWRRSPLLQRTLSGPSTLLASYGCRRDVYHRRARGCDLSFERERFFGGTDQPLTDNITYALIAQLLWLSPLLRRPISVTQGLCIWPIKQRRDVLTVVIEADTCSSDTKQGNEAFTECPC